MIVHNAKAKSVIYVYNANAGERNHPSKSDFNPRSNAYIFV